MTGRVPLARRVVARDSDDIGGIANGTPPRGAARADADLSNAVAGGDVSRPERAVPSGSGGVSDRWIG